jgi:histone acetyltransferase (RNA polymerase elongator complex component)
VGKGKGTLTAKQVQDLLRAGITCERDPSEVVAELAKAPQRPNVKEAIAILKGTRCRKEANKEAQAQRAQRQVEQVLLTRKQANDIIEQFLSIKDTDTKAFAQFTKDRVLQEFKQGRNRKALIKQLDELIAKGKG